MHLAAHKVQRLLREIVSGIDVPALQHGRETPSDAPHILYREFSQHFLNVLWTMHVAAALEFGVLLAQFGSDFGERFRVRDPYTDGYSRVFQYLVGNIMGVTRSFVLNQPRADKVRNIVFLAITCGLIIIKIFSKTP